MSFVPHAAATDDDLRIRAPKARSKTMDVELFAKTVHPKSKVVMALDSCTKSRKQDDGFRTVYEDSSPKVQGRNFKG